MENKICRICFIEQPLSNFYKHNKTKDGLYNECKMCITAKAKLYHIQNKTSILERQKEYRLKNREYFNIKNKEWNKKNGYLKNYQKNRIENDSFFKFKNRLRTLIRLSITKQGYTKKSKCFEILGCNYEFLIKHIESLFIEGMSWSNYGKWHIDHIIPMSSALTENDVIKLNHYTNLQPLWAIDNLKKYNKNETFKSE